LRSVGGRPRSLTSVTVKKGGIVKKLFKILVIALLGTIGYSAPPQKSLWREATSIFGSDADRYLYLALPLAVEEGRLLFPLYKDGTGYYVESASYSVNVKNGSSESSFDVDFSIRKRKLNIRGVKENIVVDIGEKELFDISYIVKEGERRREYHNYFKSPPRDMSIHLFPGFYGSALFGRYVESRAEGASGYVGCRVVDDRGEYVWLDPSQYTNMGAKPYSSGDRSLFERSSLLDYAAENWDLVSELRIWNMFHYGISRPKERNLTGFLKMEFYVNPVPEPQMFGKMRLPFSNIWYEVNYELSSELAKAALFASDFSLVPKRSYFVFRKRSENKRIDLDIEITVKRICFEKADRIEEVETKER